MCICSAWLYRDIATHKGFVGMQVLEHPRMQRPAEVSLWPCTVQHQPEVDEKDSDAS